MRSHARSPAAKAWQYLYKTARWQRRRADQLAHSPLCERCSRKRRTVVATVAHHVDAHQGDLVKFFEGKLESLCKPCHDSSAQSEDRRGYSTEVGIDGFPIDPAHPANQTPGAECLVSGSLSTGAAGCLNFRQNQINAGSAQHGRSRR